jgi:VanZ family protein
MGSAFTAKLKWLLHWLPAALAVAMIACESTATMSADNTSRWLLPVWTHLFGPISMVHWAIVHHLLRKTGHFIGYGTVSLAFFYGWQSSLQADSIRSLWSRAAGWAILCTFLVASADEFHQSFLPGRTSSPYDVGLDLCGAIAAHFVLFLWMSRTSRRTALRIA